MIERIHKRRSFFMVFTFTFMSVFSDAERESVWFISSRPDAYDDDRRADQISDTVTQPRREIKLALPLNHFSYSRGLYATLSIVPPKEGHRVTHLLEARVEAGADPLFKVLWFADMIATRIIVCGQHRRP
jgi:hypothetical protein